MKIFITLLFLLPFLKSNAQSTSLPDTSKTLNRSDDSIYTHPEVEAKFKKGSWSDFLQKNMTYPKEAKKLEIQGTVVVQYIIESDGSITNVQSITGPNELREDAANLIRKSPKWTPALNHGQPVRSIHKQPILYRLER